MTNTFGSAVRQARMRHGLTQAQLAELVPCSREFICFIEKGHYFGGPVVRAGIAKALDDPLVTALANQRGMTIMERKRRYIFQRDALSDLVAQFTAKHARAPESVEELTAWVTRLADVRAKEAA